VGKRAFSSTISQKANNHPLDTQTDVPSGRGDNHMEQLHTSEAHTNLTEQLDVLADRLVQVEARLQRLDTKTVGPNGKPTEDNQKDEVAAIVHDQVIDQVTLIMGIATLAFGVIMGLLAWLIQNVLRRDMQETFDKGYEDRVSALERKHDVLWQATSARQFLTHGHPLWMLYEKYSGRRPVPPEEFLDTIIEFAQFAYKNARKAREVNGSTAHLEVFYEAQNNLAYYLAERGKVLDSGTALDLADKLPEAVEYFKKNRAKEKFWYEMEETRAKVLLTYCSVAYCRVDNERKGAKKAQELDLERALRQRACTIVQALFCNSDIPETWRHGLKARYMAHCQNLDGA